MGAFSNTFGKLAHHGTLLNQYPSILKDGNTIIWLDAMKSKVDLTAENVNQVNNRVSKIYSRLDENVFLSQSAGDKMPAKVKNGIFFYRSILQNLNLNIHQPTYIYLAFDIVSIEPSQTVGFFDGAANLSGLFYKGSPKKGVIYAGNNLNGNDLVVQDTVIYRIKYNGSSSSIQLNENAAVVGNAGTTDMVGLTLGTWGSLNGVLSSNYVLRDMIVRGNSVGESDIYEYLKKKHITGKSYKKITIIGDSISDYRYSYWVNNFERLYTSHVPSIMNVALAGARIAVEMTTQVVLAKDHNPEIIIVELGTNDADNTGVGDTYKAQLIQLKTDHPLATIYCMSILPTTNTDHGTRAYKNPMLKAKAEEVADIVWWDTDGWIDPSTDTYDGLHPNNSGGIKIATEVLNRIV